MIKHLLNHSVIFFIHFFNKTGENVVKGSHFSSDLMFNKLVAINETRMIQI